MFSIFDYLRRRTCDSFLAGAYDALEILESDKAVTPAEPVEIADDEKSTVKNLLPEAVPAASKISEPLKIQTHPKPTPTAAPQKNPSPAQKQPQKTPPSQPPAGKSPPVLAGKMPTIPIQPAPNVPSPPKELPPPSLFNGEAGQEKPLPPRKRGRPRKYPPGGSTP